MKLTNMLVDLSFDSQKTADQIIKSIKNTLYGVGFTRVMVGLSGGVDSVTACILAIKALGEKNVHVVLLPYGEFDKKGLDLAKEIVKEWKIPHENIHLTNIKPFVDEIAKIDSQMDKIRKGNIMMRVRMIILYDLAKKLKALVLGTENKTEHLLGYFTRYGDEASDLEPIRNLYKTQVKKLAFYLGVPKKIIDKTPSAGLWEGQTDEGEFGFTYEEADQILYLYVEKKENIEEIVSRGFKKDLVEKVIKRMKENEYKQRVPYILL